MVMIDFTMVKLEIFIPTSHFDVLREALRSAGAGALGNYDSTLSYSLVKGCWRPLPGADPYDGEIGILCEAEEYKVEVCCEAENVRPGRSRSAEAGCGAGGGGEGALYRLKEEAQPHKRLRPRCRTITGVCHTR